MKTTQGQKESVSLFQSFAEKLATRVPKKTKTFLLSLIFGALLTISRRRTVTQLLKAAQNQRQLLPSILPHAEHRTQGGANV